MSWTVKGSECGALCTQSALPELIRVEGAAGGEIREERRAARLECGKDGPRILSDRGQLVA